MCELCYGLYNCPICGEPDEAELDDLLDEAENENEIRNDLKELED